MPRASDLGARRQTSVEYDGHTINLVFRPAAINSEWDDLVQKKPEKKAEFLARVLIGWDILDDNDRPIPPTLDFLRKLPLDLTSMMADAIFEAMLPKPKRGATS